MWKEIFLTTNTLITLVLVRGGWLLLKDEYRNTPQAGKSVIEVEDCVSCYRLFEITWLSVFGFSGNEGCCFTPVFFKRKLDS